MVAPFTVPVQAKLPLALITVQPVAPLPPARVTSPVDDAPIFMVPAPNASSAKLPAAVDTVLPPIINVFTVVAVNVPPVTDPPLNVPPLIVAPFKVPSQLKLPLPLLTVQPVAPRPPANKIFPVDVAPSEMVPVVPASTVKLVAAAATATAPAETFKPLTAVADNVPPVTVAPA